MDAPADVRALLEALDEPSLLIHGDRVILANTAARQLFGRISQGSNVRLALRHPHALEPILSQRTGDVEVTGIGGSGRPWIMSVRRAGDDLLLVRLADRSAARAAEKMRVDFVANASHELRTPLATLIGYAETLREQSAEVDDATRRRFVTIIHDEARRMQRVVEDLISLSRIEAERFSPPRDPIDIAALVEESVGHWRAIAEERGSALAVEVEPELPATTGDRNQISQLLDNLIGNALRYGRAGTPVRIGIRQEAEMVRLTVSDEGEGIPAIHIPRITERFYRVDASRSRALGGTGLGLSIVKHIVERHRGRLEIESTVGRGTDVHILLPVAAQQLS